MSSRISPTPSRSGPRICPVCGVDAPVSERHRREEIVANLARVVGNSEAQACDFPDYVLRRCPSCTLEFSDPALEPPAEFYLWLTGSGVPYPARRWEWDECRRLLAEEPVAAAGIRIVVDVGCGSGTFLAMLDGIPGVRGIGLDVNRSVVDACVGRGQEAFLGTLADLRARLPDGVHAFTMWHVVEHVAEPVRLLEEARESLKPGGRIYFSVPLSPMSYERSWRDPLNAPPHHLSRWNVPALRALAARLDMRLQLSMPDADPWSHRVLRALALQAVPAGTRLGRPAKARKLALFLARRPWAPFVEAWRQLAHARMDGKVQPDLVLACLQHEAPAARAAE